MSAAGEETKKKEDVEMQKPSTLRHGELTFFGNRMEQGNHLDWHLAGGMFVNLGVRWRRRQRKSVESECQTLKSKIQDYGKIKIGGCQAMTYSLAIRRRLMPHKIATCLDAATCMW